MIPRTVLVAFGAFDELSQAQVGAAIARGLSAGGWQVELCPVDSRGAVDVHEMLEMLDFDTHMRRARAVVIAEHLLKERALLGSATFEMATRARQAGVPAYALTAINLLDPFDARILDLQAVIQASGARGLARGARRLAGLL